MAKRIHKFKLMMSSSDRSMPLPDQAIRMQKGATILHAGFQGNSISELCVWAMIDEQNDECMRRFGVQGTGNALPLEPGVHVSTAVSNLFVWHIFDKGEVPL